MLRRMQFWGIRGSGIRYMFSGESEFVAGVSAYAVEHHDDFLSGVSCTHFVDK